MTQALMERYTMDALAPPRTQVIVTHQDLRSIPVHWHDFYELVYLTEGEGVHVCNGEREVIGPDVALLLGPADFHGFEPWGEGSLRGYNIVIDAWTMEHNVGRGLLERSPGPWMVRDLSGARFDLDRLWEESNMTRPHARRLMQALLACIMIRFVRELPMRSPQAEVDDPIRRALFYLHQHFREPVTLAQAAAQANLSPNYFSERFHDTTGVSFQNYVQHRRLHFARSLLATTDISVVDVSVAAGFNSASHFARAYRSRYGCAPTHDRARYRAAGDRIKAAVPTPRGLSA